MSEYVQLLYDWINAHPTWAQVLLFVVAMVDAIFILGAFVPAGIMLFAVGALIALGSLDLWTTAVAAGYVAEADRTPEQRGALARIAELADEVLAADAVVIGSPLYNFGIAAHLKTWVDALITDPRFAPGSTPLAGRPVVLVVSRGGGYGPGTPREGWDHGSGWITRILRDVWGADVTVVETELTLADVVPAMSELRPLAAEKRERARVDARTAGERVAAVTPAASS